MRFDEDAVNALAQATWTRCRSLPERKAGATWGSITDEYRDGWRNGARQDLAALDAFLDALPEASDECYACMSNRADGLSEEEIAQRHLETRRLDGDTRIDQNCAERWPEARSFGYDPRCCRFPKSCSATIVLSGDPDRCTQKDYQHQAGAVECRFCVLEAEALEAETAAALRYERDIASTPSEYVDELMAEFAKPKTTD